MITSKREKLKRAVIIILFAIVSMGEVEPISTKQYKEPLTMDYWVLVDEHDTLLPDPEPDGWFYNASGGDRGKMNDSQVTFTWDGSSVYTMTSDQSYNWGGMWYSLVHIDQDNIPINFKQIFGLYIKPEFQGEIVELEITVDSYSGSSGARLKIELKDEQGGFAHTPWEFNNLHLYDYPTTFNISLNPPDIENVEVITWILENASTGDEIAIDSVRLKARVPDLSPEEQAFLWTYSWLMANYDSNTGMVQDRPNFYRGDFENVTATAKAAKITYYAYKKGYVTYDTAVTIITKIADTLINVLPRGPVGINTLWPHYTKNGGSQIVEGSEWASGDTAYAALDIITVLELINDPQVQIAALQTFLEEIDWQDLLTPQGFFSHGYYYDGSAIPSVWSGFGMETVGVTWAYASVTGEPGNMEVPPSDNGSGFIDNAHYPLVLSRTDYWGNSWNRYRSEMADLQLAWYDSYNPNQYLNSAGLFGLSAAEVPEVASYPGTTYLAYGTGGKGLPEDGDGEVVVLHYSGMIADMRFAEATAMWETLRDRSAPFLENRIIISPLNNMESMRVDKDTGALTINYLKGSWNMALQAEGWALRDPGLRYEVFSAINNNDFLKRGYKKVQGVPPYPIKNP